MSNQTALSYNPGALTYDTTYYWNIIAWDNHSAYATSIIGDSGDSWNFTTKSKSSGGSDGGDGGGSSANENKKPIADASAGEPYHGYVNSAIAFDGSKSNDPDGNLTKWFWVFGDNTNETGKTVQHTYLEPGTYTVTLTVTDNEGAINTDTTTCVITQPNRLPTTPIITGPTNGTKNTMYTYTALSTDADNDTIQYTFNWGDPLSTSQLSGFLPNGSAYTVNHNWTVAGRYEVTVTVTDNQTTSSSNITVYIDAVQAGGVGYLLDNNGDGIYDTFYSDVLKQITTVQKKNGNYNIDSDGNGNWDLTYNTTNGLTSSYQEQGKTPGFEIVIIIGAIALVMLWKRKKKDSK
ncbi:PKD domain protein [uncultured archaeon]|nr:PKD domain protein [uncultured archaeon]